MDLHDLGSAIECIVLVDTWYSIKFTLLSFVSKLGQL